MFIGSQCLAQSEFLEDDLEIMGVFRAVIKYMLSKQELLIKVPKKIFRKRENFFLFLSPTKGTAKYLLYITSVMPHILNTPRLSLFVGILRKKVLTANWGEP